MRFLETLLIPVWKGKIKTVESCYSKKNDVFVELSLVVVNSTLTDVISWLLLSRILLITSLFFKCKLVNNSAKFCNYGVIDIYISIKRSSEQRFLEHFLVT